jgi:hypothetical protein
MGKKYDILSTRWPEGVKPLLETMQNREMRNFQMLVRAAIAEYADHHHPDLAEELRKLLTS